MRNISVKAIEGKYFSIYRGMNTPKKICLARSNIEKRWKIEEPSLFLLCYIESVIITVK